MLRALLRRSKYLCRTNADAIGNWANVSHDGIGEESSELTIHLPFMNPY